MTFDIGGVIIEDKGTREITTKNGQKKIRSFTLIDNSSLEEMEADKVIAIEVNVWGDDPEELNYIKENEFVVIKKVRSSEFRGGTNINASQTDEAYSFSQVKHRKECFTILKWYKDKLKSEFNFSDNLYNISAAGDSNSSNVPQQVNFQY